VRRCRVGGAPPTAELTCLMPRPGNSTGDRQMPDYTKDGDGPQLAMQVLHDDTKNASTRPVRRWDCPTPSLAPYTALLGPRE